MAYINKLWVKTEGDYSLENDALEQAEIQALWSRAISPYFDFQTGVRYDFEPVGLSQGVIGFQGLAPYWFDIDVAAFVSENGDLTARLEATYELLLTQRLILQPRAELEFAAPDIPEINVSSGLSTLDAGLRLRYEFQRQLAPYLGVEWQGSFGDTADLIEATGGDHENTVFVFGVRIWY